MMTINGVLTFSSILIYIFIQAINMTALSAMLDELMGKDRDCGPDEKRPSVNWDTPEVSFYI